MNVSVVIPQYNGWSMTHSLLYDLYNWCHGITEVLLVDNGSTEKDGRDWWLLENKMLPLRVLSLKENIGFLRAANVGMREATGNIVILISNDVEIREDIVTTIKKHLEKPLTMVGGRLLSGDTGWNVFDNKVYPYLEGWLLACWKPDWKSFGGFDERFSPNDYEDVDLSTTAISKGFTLVGLDSPEIAHKGASTIGYSPTREALTKINREKFRAKWLQR